MKQCICPYCNQICEHVNEVYYDGGGFAYDKYQCTNCPVRVEFLVNDKLIDIRFLWEEPNKRFRVFCDIPDKFCTIQLQVISKNDWKVDEVELNFLPDWDPKTIQQKIKTYLPFL